MMVGYLLGTASELEQSQIETRYFREPRFYEQMLALEEEVICDYLNRILTANERQRFEQHFLNSPRRRKKYESTRKWLAFVADRGPLEVSQSPQPTVRAWLAVWPERLHSFLMPKLNFVWSLGLVAVLSLGVWLLSLQVSALRHEVSQNETQQLAAKKPGQRLKSKSERAHRGNENPSAPVAELTDQLQASLDPSFMGSATSAETTHLLSVNLRTSHMRSPSEAHKILLPSGLTTLQLRLALDNTTPAAANSYHLVLKTLAGQVILRRSNVSNQVIQSDRSVTLDIPAQQLRPGYYALSLIALTAQQEPRLAEEVFFQIVR